MVTPDFEDWLRRQDIPVEDTTTIDRYTRYLEEELGIHGKSLMVAKGIFPEKYESWAPLGITPYPRHYTVAGEPFIETRYAISGIPGAWGRESALLYGEAIAREMGLYDISERISIWYEEEYG